MLGLVGSWNETNCNCTDSLVCVLCVSVPLLFLHVILPQVVPAAQGQGHERCRGGVVWAWKEEKNGADEGT